MLKNDLCTLRTKIDFEFDGKRVKDEGILENFDIGIVEARNLIMKARLEMGWISNEDYEKETTGKTRDE